MTQKRDYQITLERSAAVIAAEEQRLDQRDLDKSDRKVEVEIWTAQTDRDRQCRTKIENFVQYGKKFGVTVEQVKDYFAVSEEVAEKALIQISDQGPDGKKWGRLRRIENRFIHRDHLNP